MKRVLTIAVGIPLTLGMLVIGIRLFHLGPFRIHPGDNFLLAHLALTGGPEFFVVGHRNDSVTEPHSVTLYKVETNRATYLYSLAFEDSYWWHCSIRSNTVSGEIEIRADGGVAARYLPEKDLVVSSSYKVLQRPQATTFWKLEELLATSKR